VTTAEPCRAAFRFGPETIPAPMRTGDAPFRSSRMAEAAGARQAQQADAPQPENRVAVGAR